MTSAIDEYFCLNYATSRERFHTAARRSGFVVESYVTPLVGPGGEELATDTLLVGDPNAENLIIIISGTHGLEGLAGSGIQIALLDRLDLTSLDNIALLFVHALNPWGVAYRRRQNEDNIDINRNFLCFSGQPIENDHYDLLHPIICRPELFVDDERNENIVRAIANFIDNYGDQAFYRALFQGQSRHSGGVGYCGTKPAWSNRTIRGICRRHGKYKKCVAIVDLHTGLGPHGHGTVLTKVTTGSINQSLLETCFGSDFVSVQGDSMMPYSPIGDMMGALVGEFDAQTSLVSVALEFGTFATKDLMQLQIDDTWLCTFGDETSAHGVRLKQKLQNFFSPASPEWRKQLVMRSEQVVMKIIQAFYAK